MYAEGAEADFLGEFDYIIVGAGSAGCLLANRLSADPACKVLLIEAGGEDDWMWLHIPVGCLYTINHPRVDWCFKTEPESGLNNRIMDYPRGRVLGGSSSINGMIYMRGQAADYDAWRDMGNPGWGWEDVLPCFKAHEDFAFGADPFHGSGGEWRVEGPRVRWEILDAVRNAGVELGIPKIEDFNRGDNEGSGYFHVNHKNGKRWNAAQGFLRPILKRPNLSLLTRAHARRLRIEGGRCEGVEFWQADRLKFASCTGEKSEVILAAGTIGSPQLLQLSGIGPGSLLREHGLEVKSDLPGVGENLQDHLQLRMSFKISNTLTVNQLANSMISKVKMAAEYFLFKQGPMTMGPSQLGIFARSNPALPTPDLQFHVQPLSLGDYSDGLDSFAAFTASACDLRPESRGSVRIKSFDSRIAPEIRLNYLSTQADQDKAIAALRLTRRLAATRALSRFAPQEFRPGSSFQTDAELIKAAGAIGTTIFHPVGTCKMGPRNDSTAVVDNRLRVRGVGGLRVVDASIMPTIISGNTAAPAMMIGEKGAALILEESR